MKLPDAFLEEIRARTPLSALVGRTVKLSRSGRQMKGCCPFHAEKTPSFYVYDDGYHCFGCGAHGDAIGFVMQTSNRSFIEAVQSLAAEAGLDMPRAEPSAEAADRRRLDLHAVLDAAGAFYARGLAAPEGAQARAYLARRGVTADSIATFGLGWSGDGRGALAAELAGLGMTPSLLLEAGLLRAGEDGAPRGDLFFNRLMFPIRDRRGRIISFGGRTLGDGQPKYLNGPETPLFSKRRTLYGLDLAREAVRKGATLVVVEGYMDVIALNQAGFGGAVAPLGTALTEEQLEELWRQSPCPVLCFDGDAAGARAAARAVTVALPLLQPDKTLSIVTLPPGEDPDTLVRRRGPAEVALLLDGAMPLHKALFTILHDVAKAEGQDFVADPSPEKRTRFQARIRAAADSIRHPGLAKEYRASLADAFWGMRSARFQGKAARPAARMLPRPIPDASRVLAGRAAALTATLLHHPALLHDVEEAYASVALPPPMDRLRRAILHTAGHAEALDSAALADHLRSLGLGEELDIALAAAPSFSLAETQASTAEAGWWHIFGLMHRDGLEAEVSAARAAWQASPDQACFARLNALVIALNRLRSGEQGLDETEVLDD
jgi:DNA primase